MAKLGKVAMIDDYVGRLLATLDDTGMSENTVVVFWSDHGYHLGEHGLWAKTSNFELDARVPLIISSPDSKPGQHSPAMVELLDLYPTLADLCDLDAPVELEGVSLKPLLETPTGFVRQYALTQHPRPAYYKGAPEAMGYSMRTTEVRYTEWRNWKTGKIIARELYNHRKDPGENHNIAATQGGPVQKLSVRMNIQFPVQTHP